MAAAGGQAETNTRREVWGSRATFILSGMGAAIGLGAVWRFPYLAYVNGGGAFLIPYTLSLFVLGIPLLFLELSLGQKAQEGVVGVFTSISPVLKSAGWIMVMSCILICSYYVMLLSWSLHFLVESCSPRLPWKGEAQEYFDHEILGMPKGEGATFSVNDTSTVSPYSVLGSLAVWLCVFLAVRKGIKSSGWVVWITVPLPFVLLIVLFFRGVTLPGARKGIQYFIEPDFSKLSNPRIWTDACTQTFFSQSLGQGVMVALGSYVPRSQNIWHDTLIISFTNWATAIFAGFTVFSILGYMADQENVEVKDVVRFGPGLAFVAFPEALALMPAAPFFAVIFFLMILTLGIDSAFALVEGITTVVKDTYNLHHIEQPIAFAVCCVGFMIGLVYATDGGLLFLDLIDHFTATFLLVPGGFVECVAVAWIYGARRHIDEVAELIGIRLHSSGWDFLLRFVVPPVLAVVFVVQVVEEIRHPAEEREGERFPGWALSIGWVVTMVPVCLATLLAWLEYRKRGGITGTASEREPLGVGVGVDISYDSAM